MGLKWVTMYYFDKCPSWDWYFPYDIPPLLSDILKYIDDIKINKIIFNEGKPLKPFVQLLCVLPPQSNYLLPSSLKKLMTNPNSSLSHIYPMDFEQDYINKSKYWMAIPQLPPLEIDLVKYIYTKYQNELSKEDEFRNRLCDDYIFN
jgi:5'-3' exonuclease